ncbi:Protein MRVI1 [Lamellibrachia satsuma]|nr:Protein MRVI1 [Lamellibrachia satsuma]
MPRNMTWQRKKTSHSCTSLERVQEMSSDGYCTMFTEAGDTERKLVNDVSDVQLSPTQLEDKFCDLALRFKDNKENLEERVKQHKHTRDVTEENISRELAGLNELLKSMTSNDTEVQGLCTRLRQHISVLEHTSKQLASRSEAHGAVQQELRESSQVNLMIEYVENLKRKYENLKHTHSITAEQSVGARPGMRKQNIKLPRRATVQTISPPTYQGVKCKALVPCAGLEFDPKPGLARN